MLKSFFSIFCFLIIASQSLLSQEWTRDRIQIARSFDEIENIFSTNSDSIYFINFWATWCGPCVREMPYIEALNSEFEDEKFKVILVSLDFEKKIDSRVIPYLNKNKIQSEVILLLDPKEVEWIDRVDKSWSGAIPISLVISNTERLFFEQEFHSSEEIINIIKPLMNKI